jgi:hypothetical protein
MKEVEAGKRFLSALLIGVRTAAHAETHKNLVAAIQSVHEAADALFQATGGFSIQFDEESAFINGTKVRFEGGAYATILRNTLKARDIKTIGMKKPPSLAAVRKLVLLFAPEGAFPDEPAAIGEPSARIAYPPKPGATPAPAPRIDRRLHAVWSYTKLVLALREQLAQPNPDAKLHAARIVLDLADLARDRADILLRLAASPSVLVAPESHGANACVLSIVLGHALSLSKNELADLGMAALFYDSLGRVIAENAIAKPGFVRAFVAAELYPSAKRRAKPHLYSRIVAVAVAYERLTSGYGVPSGDRVHALDALGALAADHSGRFDPRIVDLLISVLRAFPLGVEVVLDSGESGVVIGLGSRWDRPIVRTTGEPVREVDLLQRDANGRFAATITGTRQFYDARVAPAAAPSASKMETPRPLKSRETISAHDAVSKVKLPWVTAKERKPE